MRSLLDTEEEEESQPSEITLSTASLLGIFFGLVLICGVFFGFGYSMGRGTQLGTQVNKASAAPDGNPAQSEEPKTAESSQPAPAAQAEPDAQPVNAEPAPAAASPKPVETVAPETPKERPSPAHPLSHELETVEKAAIDSAPSPAPQAPGQPVVQVAAVAHQQDAEALVSALRQRGYGVVVRSEPQDNLWHVQVGPFADRNQAAAMKQKLLADGYNAIIKQ